MSKESHGAEQVEDPSITEIHRINGAWLGPAMSVMEKRLIEIASSHGEPFSTYAGETISAGGKRLRPMLLFVAAGPDFASSDRAVRSGTAVELIHSASLVHDDVLDNAALRRGRPTVFAREGRDMATAVGDYLFSRAFSEVARNDSSRDVQILATASAALAEGELMQRADAWDTSITEARYLKRCELKTGALFRAACELGANCSETDVEVLGQFGEQIGVAFQLLDDVLDVSGPVERTGKPRGTDLLDGTVTLPYVIAAKRDPAISTLDLRSVASTDAAADLCDSIEASGALDLARERAVDLVASAKRLLEDIPSPLAETFALIANAVVDRYA